MAKCKSVGPYTMCSDNEVLISPLNASIRCVAFECTQQGLPVRAHALEETYTISGISGT
jgi:hypothetical protein